MKMTDRSFLCVNANILSYHKNQKNMYLRLTVSIISWPIDKIRPGIFTDPEGGGVDPRYFVVLKSLTLLGNEARP